MSHADQNVKKNPAHTQFDPSKPADPSKPDFTDEGKLFDGVAFGDSDEETSKSVSIEGRAAQNPNKTLYVLSDQTGSFVVEVLLDDSERSGGNPVWRTLDLTGSPFSVSANVLKSIVFPHTARQARVKFTNGSTPAVVNAWLFTAR